MAEEEGILLSNGANCTVLRAVVLTQYRRVTDGQMDGRTNGIAIASTALAKRHVVIKLLLHTQPTYLPWHFGLWERPKCQGKNVGCV